MIIKFSQNFAEKLNKLKRKNKALEKRIDVKLKLLVQYPNHPSLRLHKINGKYDSWSISINMSLRILFVYRKYGILLVDIGTHDQVY